MSFTPFWAAALVAGATAPPTSSRRSGAASCHALAQQPRKSISGTSPRAQPWRRFTPIYLHEPEPEEAQAMIEGSLSAYETHHGCSFEASSVRCGAPQSSPYMTEGAPAGATYSVGCVMAYRRLSGW